MFERSGVAAPSLAEALLASALASPDDEPATLAWLDQQRSAYEWHVERRPIEELDGWRFEDSSGDLVHDSGRFFSVRGLRVVTNTGTTQQWDQPIIDQPEVGMLKVVIAVIDGMAKVLVQAKGEPGNQPILQLAPTLQATRSNLDRAHSGAPPPLAGWETDSGLANLVDRVQPEQGARFFQKKNRNNISLLADAATHEVASSFRWLSLGDLAALMQHDNVVNMDLRSVLGCLPWFAVLGALGETTGDGDDWATCVLRSWLGPDDGGCEDLLHWLARVRSGCALSTRRIPLGDVADWERVDGVIRNRDRRHFRVVGIATALPGREAVRWCQPMIEPVGSGLVAFVARRREGVVEVLVQAKVEPGNSEVVAIAPTVQLIVDPYLEPGVVERPPFLDVVLNGRARPVDTYQSEEGGRFLQETNRYVVVEVGADELADVPAMYRWTTLGELGKLIKYSTVVNVQARSLVALMQCARPAPVRALISAPC